MYNPDIRKENYKIKKKLCMFWNPYDPPYQTSFTKKVHFWPLCVSVVDKIQYTEYRLRPPHR